MNCPSLGVKLTVRVPRLVERVPTPKPPSVWVHESAVKSNLGTEALGRNSYSSRRVSVRLKTFGPRRASVVVVKMTKVASGGCS